MKKELTTVEIVEIVEHVVRVVTEREDVVFRDMMEGAQEGELGTRVRNIFDG